MTPLVDVMLVLLIIFIITVPAETRAVNGTPPRASSQSASRWKPEMVRLSVQADGATTLERGQRRSFRLCSRPSWPKTRSPTCTSAGDKAVRY